MREFRTRKHNGCGAKRLEGKHWCAAALDRSMILLDDVVEITATAYDDRPPVRVLLP